MAKKQTTSGANKAKFIKHEANSNESKSSMFDYLRFGESYTSLVLGIVVVIIATVLLLSFIHNRNINKTNLEQIAQGAPTATLVPQAPAEATFTPAPTKVEPSATPTVMKKITPTPTVEKKKTIQVTPTKTPTAVPSITKKPTVTTAASPTQTVTKKVTPTTVPTKAVAKQEKKDMKGKIYTVQANDSLWKIAEKEYKSGYNWVDIARANKLNNPGVLYRGMKLTLPDVSPKVATVTTDAKTKQSVTETNKITGTSYTIVKGDTLWSIAVRAYGDGYKWVDIAKANNLINPSLIHTQNTLKIPRGK